MIVLAWLSDDERVREVAAQWCLLTSGDKQKVEIERLCLAVGVEPAGDFNPRCGDEGMGARN